MMLASRGRPHSRDSCTHGKPRFQTKYKNRVHNGVGNEQSTMTVNMNESKNNFGEFESNQQSHQRSKSIGFSFDKNKMNSKFNETFSKLEKLNFSHHNSETCLCNQCNCGRHLCQLHCIKPDLTKNTIYKKDFLKKKPVGNKVNISTEYDRFKGPNLEINSTYLKDFDGKNGQIEKLRPEDLLKTGGPSLNVTSYSNGFPGHYGDNQYIKPTDRHTRGYFPLRSKSTYSRVFTGQNSTRRQSQKVPDNLKTGTNWFGSTTYGNNFRHPNPEDYSSQVKVNQKLEVNPDYNRQYRKFLNNLETIYRNSFLGHKAGVCPAKVTLETRSKGFFSQTKSKFNENSDFKSLDPSFQPFSTSKHGFS